MEVIGAGFGRTGTMLLKVALEQLGFGPCYHMIEIFEHRDHVPLWEAAARGETVDWEEMFAGYRATVDWPGCSFYKELMEAYPNAKVLLSVRALDNWYESARNTIYTTLDIPDPPPGRRVVDKLVWEQTFGGDFEDRQHAIEVFEQHNEEVKKQVPPARLLVYEVREGWEPLCEFLGVEVPKDMPFPRLNDTESFNQRIQQRRQQTQRNQSRQGPR